jgi:curved DNA-binding protein CbpA
MDEHDWTSSYSRFPSSAPSSSTSTSSSSSHQSLSVRLMAVAGEFDLERKRERERYEQKNAQLSDENAALERTQIDLKNENAALTKRVAKMAVDLETQQAAVDSKTKSLERALMSTRFELAERTRMLFDLQTGFLDIAKEVQTLADIHEKVEEVDDALTTTISSSLPHQSKKILGLSLSANVQKIRSLSSSLTDVTDLSLAVKESSRFGREALLNAVEAGDVESVDSLLSGGGKNTNSSSFTYLSHSALKNSDKSNHLSSPADIALSQAVRIAAKNGHANVLKRLLQAGASVGGRGLATEISGSLMQTCLHIASMAGHEEIVKLLLTPLGSEGGTKSPITLAGISIDDRDAYRRTPLHLAAAFNRANIVKLLLREGADSLVQDIHGHTPFELAECGTTASPSAAAAAVAKAKSQNKASNGPRSGPCYISGEIGTFPPAPAALLALSDPSVLFWNGSVRATRSYNEKRFKLAIEAYTSCIENSSKIYPPSSARDTATLHYNRARAHYRLGQHVAAIEDCTLALKYDGTYKNAIAQRAECNMSLFDFDRAVRDLAAVIEADPSDRQWQRRLIEARANRDLSHYGILGLVRESDGTAVKKAYRSLCLRWHPDKHKTGPEDMARANTAFRRITLANEILSDPYKRLLYDMEPGSSLGTPTAAILHAHALQCKKDAQVALEKGLPPPLESPLPDGFDKWNKKETEAESERAKEVSPLADADVKFEAEAESIRAQARAIRKAICEQRNMPTSSAPVVPLPVNAKIPTVATPILAPSIPPRAAPPPPPTANTLPPTLPSQSSGTTTTAANTAAALSAAASAIHAANATSAASNKTRPINSTASTTAPQQAPAPPPAWPAPPRIVPTIIPTQPPTRPAPRANDQSSTKQAFGCGGEDVGASAATARAKAAVAQAEAFVRLVQANNSLAREAGNFATSSSSSSSGANPSTTPAGGASSPTTVDPSQDTTQGNNENEKTSSSNRLPSIYSSSSTTLNDEPTVDLSETIDQDQSYNDDKADIRSRIYERARRDAQSRFKSEAEALQRDIERDIERSTFEKGASAIPTPGEEPKRPLSYTYSTSNIGGGESKVKAKGGINESSRTSTTGSAEVVEEEDFNAEDDDDDEDTTFHKQGFGFKYQGRGGSEEHEQEEENDADDDVDADIDAAFAAAKSRAAAYANSRFFGDIGNMTDEELLRYGGLGGTNFSTYNEDDEEEQEEEEEDDIDIGLDTHYASFPNESYIGPGSRSAVSAAVEAARAAAETLAELEAELAGLTNEALEAAANARERY